MTYEDVNAIRTCPRFLPNELRPLSLSWETSFMSKVRRLFALVTIFDSG